MIRITIKVNRPASNTRRLSFEKRTFLRLTLLGNIPDSASCLGSAKNIKSSAPLSLRVFVGERFILVLTIAINTN